MTREETTAQRVFTDEELRAWCAMTGRAPSDFWAEIKALTGGRP